MKKSILFSMAFAAILSSCSKEENIDYTQPSEFEITFGSKSEISAGVEELGRASRASVDKWDNTNVGVFVLAKNDDADWQNETVRDVLWNNASAIIDEDNSSTVDYNGQTKYYPNQGDREFSFFGYHPYEEGGVTVTSSNITKKFTITGQEDILWGKAEVEGGYNAKYFRANPDATPDIAFGHMLTKLQFKVKSSASFEPGQSFKVKGIRVVNVPNELTLTVADKTSSNAGVIKAGEANQEITAYSDLNGIIIQNGTNTTNAGEPVMLYSNNTDQSFSVVIEMEDPEGHSVFTQPSDPIKPTSGCFKQGTAYNVTLSLNSYKLIEFSASLANWETGEDVEVEI